MISSFILYLRWIQAQKRMRVDVKAVGKNKHIFKLGGLDDNVKTAGDSDSDSDFMSTIWGKRLPSKAVTGKKGKKEAEEDDDEDEKKRQDDEDDPGDEEGTEKPGRRGGKKEKKKTASGKAASDKAASPKRGRKITRVSSDPHAPGKVTRKITGKTTADKAGGSPA